jgi:hypothetical protein
MKKCYLGIIENGQKRVIVKNKNGYHTVDYSDNLSNIYYNNINELLSLCLALYMTHQKIYHIYDNNKIICDKWEKLAKELRLINVDELSFEIYEAIIKGIYKDDFIYNDYIPLEIIVDATKNYKKYCLMIHKDSFKYYRGIEWNRY